MSADTPEPGRPGRTLADYIRELIAGLGESEPKSLQRLREIVGDRTALITVSGETVHLGFVRASLHVELLTPETTTPASDGQGFIERQTVLALLAGKIEVTEAIQQGLLHLQGPYENVVRMGAAIEQLIDGAVRTPRLQRLAKTYRDDPDREAFRPDWGSRDGEAERVRLRVEETRLLDRIGVQPASGRDFPA
jgi:hypothetical protein